MSRTVDIAAVRRIMARLRRRLSAHPELRVRTADYLAGTLPEESDDDEADPQTQNRQDDRTPRHHPPPERPT